MSEVLAEYKSKSSPGKTYKIIQAKDGSLYCDCWTWKRTRACSHLVHYVRSVEPAIKEAHRKMNYDGDGALIVAIDRAVSSITSR